MLKKECRITRHRNHESHELKPWYMAFRKEVFQQISTKMKLPLSYIYLRTHADGAGYFTRHLIMNEESSVDNLCNSCLISLLIHSKLIFI